MRTAQYLVPVLAAITPHAATAQQSPSTACVAAIAATGYAACAEAPNGIALAGTAERAAWLTSFAQSGEERFSFTFGGTPTRYAVAELREPDSLKNDQNKLKALGYRSILPWIPHARMVATVTAAMNEAAAAQARELKLSREAEAELARTMLAKEAKRLTRFKMNESDAGVVPHELGHMWYAEAY